MMYFALGASLALAGFFVLNACLSLGAQLVFHLSARSSSPADRRARFFFLLTVLPASVSAFCALFLLIPSYLALEPRSTSERIGWIMVLFSALAAWLLTYSVLRTVASWRRSRVILQDWLRRSDAVALSGVGIPAYKLPAHNSKNAFPVIAVIGAFRPRLFVSAQIFDALNDEELAATLQHEIGHLVAQDNLKRWLARISPAVFSFLPGAERLARMWHAASEECADRYAVQEGKAAPLSLASALIKVSRMMPPPGSPAVTPAGAYFLERDDLPDVARRVHALLEVAESSGTTLVSQNPARRLVLLYGLTISSILLVAASYSSLLVGVHEVLERFLHLVS